MIYAVIASFFWGTMYYFQSKLISKGMNLVTMWGLNMMPNVLYLLFFYDKFADNFSLKDNFYLLIFWLCGSIMGSFFIFQSLRNTSVVIAAVIEMTYPLFILLFKFILEKERIEWSQIVGILVTIFGVFLVVKKD